MEPKPERGLVEGQANTGSTHVFAQAERMDKDSPRSQPAISRRSATQRLTSVSTETPSCRRTLRCPAGYMRCKWNPLTPDGPHLNLDFIGFLANSRMRLCVSQKSAASARVRNSSGIGSFSGFFSFIASALACVHLSGAHNQRPLMRLDNEIDAEVSSFSTAAGQRQRYQRATPKRRS